MDGWITESVAIAAGMGLVGVVAGRGWAYLRSSTARRKRAGKVAALQALLDQEKLRSSQLEAGLHAQRARSFALEQELEARESDWAQSRPTPFSFDAETYQIDRSLLADGESAQDGDRIADLERQVRDLQDLLSKVTTRARSSRTRTRPPLAVVEEVMPTGIQTTP